MAKKIEDKDKLVALLEYYKKSQTEFSKMLGVTQSAVAHWIGRNKIPFTMMHTIAEKCPEIAFSWLITGLGPMLLKEGGKSENEITESYQHPQIPGLTCDEMVICHGIGFPPLISQGDIIGTKKLDDCHIYDPDRIYLITMKDGSRMLKHVTFIKEGDTYELSADASKRPLKVESDKITEIQKVVFTGKLL